MFVCTRNDYPLVLLKSWKLTLSICKLNGSFLYPNAAICLSLQSGDLQNGALASCTTFLCLCKSFKELFLVCLSVYFRKASAKVWTFSIPSKYFSRKIQNLFDYWFKSSRKAIFAEFWRLFSAYEERYRCKKSAFLTGKKPFRTVKSLFPVSGARMSRQRQKCTNATWNTQH